MIFINWTCFLINNIFNLTILKRSQFFFFTKSRKIQMEKEQNLEKNVTEFGKK